MIKRGNVWLMIGFLAVVAIAMFGAIWMNQPAGKIEFASLTQGDIAGCGEIVDSGTYMLTDNYKISDGGCFKISADNVIIDGQGFKITGDGIAGHNGIEASGRKNIAVKNLGIEKFAFGILFSDVDDSEISRNDIRLNTDDGIYLNSGSDNNLIEGNNATMNEYHGISIDASSFNTIKNNDASLNSIALNNQSGILLYNGANDNSIEFNIVDENDDVGIYVYKSLRNTINNNNASYNDYGIYLQSGADENTVTNNNAEHNIYLGITLDGSSNNRVEGNRMESNIIGGLPLFASSNNVIKDNTLVSNEYGLYIASGSTGNVFENLVVDGSGSDAISMISSQNNKFVNVQIENTAAEYSDFVVSESGKGEIRFFKAGGAINGDFSKDVKIGDNLVEVNRDASTALNVPAEITIYNVPSNLINRKILRDGVECPADICTLVSSIDSDSVVFSVTGFSKYSIGGDIAPAGTQGSGGSGGGGGGGGAKPATTNATTPTQISQPPAKTSEITPKSNLSEEGEKEVEKGGMSAFIYVLLAILVAAIILLVVFKFFKRK